MTDDKSTKTGTDAELFESLRDDLKQQPESEIAPGDTLETSRIERNLDILMSIKTAFSDTGSKRLDGDSRDQTAESIPDEWGHLKITERIGEGGFGVVYRAFDPLLERDVALKLKRQDQGDNLRNSQYIAEARRLARVNHPNVLAIHGAGINDHMVGMWADLIEGETLTRLLETEGVFSQGQIMDLLEQLASALQTIHANGLVHGDIKADNVMISDGQAILMDFGATEHLGKRPKYGSPAYMAPELFHGKPMSEWTDLYSLGALMYHLTVGRYPRSHDNGTPTRTVAEIQAELSALLGRPLAALVASLLSSEPRHRPDDVGIRQRLQQIRDMPARRRRRGVVLVVIVSLVAGLSSSLIALNRVTEERQKLEVVKDLIVESVQGQSPTNQTGPVSIQSLYERMADLSEERLQTYPVALADMRLIIGQGLARFGDEERGLMLTESGLELMLQHGQATKRDKATYYNIVAAIRKDVDDLEGAEQAIRQSIEYFSAMIEDEYEKDSEGPIGVIRGRTLLANLLGRRGLLNERLEAHRQILEDRIALIGEVTAKSAVDYYNLGYSLYAVDRPEEALEALSQSMQLLVEDGQGQIYHASFIRRAMADSLRKLGRYDEAMQQLEQSVALMRNHLPAEHVSFLHIEEVIAFTRFQSGDQLTALQQYDALFRNPDYVKQAKQTAQDRYAQVLISARRYTEAKAQYQQILDNPDPQNNVKLPWIDAALAYSEFMAEEPVGPTHTETVAALTASQRRIAESGYPLVHESALLRLWLAALSSESAEPRLTPESL